MELWHRRINTTSAGVVCKTARGRNRSAFSRDHSISGSFSQVPTPLTTVSSAICKHCLLVCGLVRSPRRITEVERRGCVMGTNSPSPDVTDGGLLVWTDQWGGGRYAS